MEVILLDSPVMVGLFGDWMYLARCLDSWSYLFVFVLTNGTFDLSPVTNACGSRPTLKERRQDKARSHRRPSDPGAASSRLFVTSLQKWKFAEKNRHSFLWRVVLCQLEGTEEKISCDLDATCQSEQAFAFSPFFS